MSCGCGRKRLYSSFFFFLFSPTSEKTTSRDEAGHLEGTTKPILPKLKLIRLGTPTYFNEIEMQEGRNIYFANLTRLLSMLTTSNFCEQYRSAGRRLLIVMIWAALQFPPISVHCSQCTEFVYHQKQLCPAKE